MARKKREEEGIGQGWLTTYGDTVTLLLTFFVLLYSFSSLDVNKFKKMVISFQGALGVLPGGQTVQEGDNSFGGRSGEDAGDVRKQTQGILDVVRKIQTMISEEGLQGQVSVTVNQRGVTISMAEHALFERGSARVVPAGKRLLARMAPFLNAVSVPLAVEGHTDSLPVMGGVYETNWGLSSMRAATVAAYLADVGGVDPLRLEAVGFSQYRPLVPNDSEPHRALNRRVDLVLLSHMSQ
ncbi:MAG TPA: flagellar motor protein MotB [Synergistaceae bacterium]|mgnify:FL=1|nr:flagellar motor protein MotB [Synergistaceae bacterium]